MPPEGSGVADAGAGSPLDELIGDELIDEVSRVVQQYRVVVEGVAIEVTVYQVLGYGPGRFVGISDYAIWNRDAGQTVAYRSTQFKPTPEEAAVSAIVDMLQYYEPGHPEYWVKG